MSSFEGGSGTEGGGRGDEETKSNVDDGGTKPPAKEDKAMTPAQAQYTASLEQTQQLLAQLKAMPQEVLQEALVKTPSLETIGCKVCHVLSLS